MIQTFVIWSLSGKRKRRRLTNVAPNNIHFYYLVSVFLFFFTGCVLSNFFKYYVQNKPLRKTKYPPDPYVYFFYLLTFVKQISSLFLFSYRISRSVPTRVLQHVQIDSYNKLMFGCNARSKLLLSL